MVKKNSSSRPDHATATSVAPFPTGIGRLRWLGPGFLWMGSATGSGELLFTPRVGALYGYVLLWALLAAVAMKWFINREVGRYTVCTGKVLLTGFCELRGPKCWAVWLIVVPQLVVAVATIAGLAGSAATALITVLPGDVRFWMIGLLLLSSTLTGWGKYSGVENVAKTIAVALAVASITAAASVFPPFAAFAAGLAPSLPARVDYREVLPWLGFALSGAAGMIWYSYWLHAKGYGAAGANDELDPKRLNNEQRAHIKGWLRQMTLDNSVAVVGTLIITLAFLILGTELLQTRGLVPEEKRVAEVLGHLLGGVWGPVGFWFMMLAVFIGFWNTVLSNQDGFGRMFANGALLLLRVIAPRASHVGSERLRKVFVTVWLTILPIGIYLLVGEPVTLLKLAGAIEAAHIPIVTALVLYINHTQLPGDLRPSRLVFGMTAIAGFFFAAFSVLYVIESSSELS